MAAPNHLAGLGVAGGVRAQPDLSRAVPGAGHRAQPQGHAHVAAGDDAVVSGAPGAELAQRRAQPGRGLRVRRTELPGGAPPVSEHAAGEFRSGAAVDQAVLRRAGAAVYGDGRVGVVSAGRLRAPPRRADRDPTAR